jgi:RNA polymerase sigma-70 factor (ECF subfamily)
MRSSQPRVKHAPRAVSFAGRIYEQYHASLHRFLVRRLRSAQSAQDVAQETYLRLLRLDRGEFIRKPQAYLYRIASNLVYELKLREQNEVVQFDSDAFEHAAETSESTVATDTSDQISVTQELEAALACLRPLHRAVFVLRKRDGLSYPEIAATLNISVHTVKKYLAQAVAQCRGVKSGGG